MFYSLLPNMEITTWLKFYKTIGRITSRLREVLFSPSYPQPKRLLFLFPLLEEHFDESIYILRRLERHPSATILLAIPMLFRGRIPTPSHQIFYFPFMKEKLSKVQLAVLMARFRYDTFDAVINLDPHLNLGMARAMSMIQAPKRIGVSGPGADDIYNIQIQTQPSSPLRAAYDQMLNLCDLGPPDDHPDYHVWG